MSEYLLSALFFLTLLLSSCGESLDDMLEDYNEGFDTGGGVIVVDENTPLCPGDEGFDESNMLRDEYFSRSDALLQVAAPYKCSDYEWVLRGMDGEVVEFKAFGEREKCALWKRRELNIYMPYALLETRATYRLTLTVKGDDGGTYTDTAAVVVYEGLP